MGLASLCLGIASVVLAALATAPCFGCASLLGLPLACLALIFGVTCLIRQALRRKKEGVPVEQDEWRYALSGIALSLVAGLWQVVIVVITKGIVL